MLLQQSLLGVNITNATREEVLGYVFETIKKGSKKQFIATPNPEMIVYATKHPTFRATLNHADIALCDGVGLVWAAKALGNPIKERITGTDFMELICEKSVEKAVTIGLLGGKEGVAEKAAKCLKKKYPGLDVAFAGHEWAGTYRTNMTNKSNRSQEVDVLFVAFGHPKQEQWIAEHLDGLPIKVAMGVGGAFDYISGNVSRAPKIVRSFGLEWLYRLVIQPWRWRRQLALGKFVLLVIKERFGISKSN